MKLPPKRALWHNPTWHSIRTNTSYCPGKP